MKSYFLFILLLLSFISLQAQKIGDAILTNEGDWGVVFYVDQEKVLLVSLEEKKTQFCTQWPIDCLNSEECEGSFDDALFNGKQNTNRMIELGELNPQYSFPILDSIPYERGWFIPSMSEMKELFSMKNSNLGYEIENVIESLGGQPMEFNYYWNAERKYWTTTQSDQGRQVLLASMVGGQSGYLDGFNYVRPIYQINITNNKDENIIHYQWNTGSAESAITVKLENSTTYSVTATNTQNACKSTASKTILVGGGTQEIYATICEGESYTDYGFNEKQTGTYTQTVKNAGCTTEITLHLTVASKYKEVFTDIACQGVYYDKHGFSVTPFSKGTYRDTLTFMSQMGCDSLVILNLSVAPITYDTITRRICQNESYKDADFNVAVNQPSGKSYYTVEKMNEDGCKSYLTLALQVDSVYQVSLMEEYEEGVAYNQNGFNIENVMPNASYRLETHSDNGCDSIVTIYFRQISTNEGVKEPTTFIPTAFTPHFEDDMNDHFMPGYEVYIYDRYGNLVCHSEDGWDGTYRGEVATAGVYVYVVIMKDGEKRKGTIEVVKAK